MHKTYYAKPEALGLATVLRTNALKRRQFDIVRSSSVAADFRFCFSSTRSTFKTPSLLRTQTVRAVHPSILIFLTLLTIHHIVQSLHLSADGRFHKRVFRNITRTSRIIIIIIIYYVHGDSGEESIHAFYINNDACV